MSSPAQPGPPRRRATGIRRPRVAGRVPGRPTGPVTADEPGAPSTPSTPRDRADLDPADLDPADLDRPGDDEAGADPTGSDPTGGVAESDGADGTGATDRWPDDGPQDDGRQDDGPQDDDPQDDSAAVGEQAQPTGKRQLRRRGVHRMAATGSVARRPRKPIPVSVLAAALALAVGLAVFFGVADARLRGTPAAQNTALVDIGTTAQVSQQIDDALKTIYSFDYTRLDQNEAAARAVITPGFAAQFNELFNQVRQLAPQQQAVVTATVNVSAVKSINGDTAVLLVFLDQQATRAQSGTQPQQLAAAGRLTVTAQRVQGTWKVADVQPR